ncbi:DNA helicase UvrD [Babesia caballi]|uniref:DNA helicase UvrD n=1 Tax=Babesia caballi TaxID=5871 RepID=A0AAV4LLI8_BABCB|nr:DNA helicase UvrD [Babesia caballi]
MLKPGYRLHSLPRKGPLHTLSSVGSATRPLSALHFSQAIVTRAVVSVSRGRGVHEGVWVVDARAVAVHGPIVHRGRATVVVVHGVAARSLAPVPVGRRPGLLHHLRAAAADEFANQPLVRLPLGRAFSAPAEGVADARRVEAADGGVEELQVVLCPLVRPHEPVPNPAEVLVNASIGDWVVPPHNPLLALGFPLQPRYRRVDGIPLVGRRQCAVRPDQVVDVVDGVPVDRRVDAFVSAAPAFMVHVVLPVVPRAVAQAALRRLQVRRRKVEVVPGLAAVLLRLLRLVVPDDASIFACKVQRLLLGRGDLTQYVGAPRTAELGDVHVVLGSGNLFLSVNVRSRRIAVTRNVVHV